MYEARRNSLKLFSQYKQIKLFSILQMLGIITNVFGHQESIAPISWILNANIADLKLI